MGKQHKKKRLAVVFVILVAVACFLIGVYAVFSVLENEKTLVLTGAGKSSSKGTNSNTVKYDVDYKDYMKGEYDVAWTIDTTADLGISLTRENLREVCMTYLYKIPFVQDGRIYSMGFSAPRNVDGSLRGLDSIGWLIFAYRNFTGVTCNASVNPVRFYQEHPKSRVTSLSGLKIGDIGMLDCNDSTDNHYGIFVGFYNENPVFIHCSNEPDSEFKTGCVRMSYLESVCDYYIEGSSPVDFQYFVRPNDIKWED